MKNIIGISRNSSSGIPKTGLRYSRTTETEICHKNELKEILLIARAELQTNSLQNLTPSWTSAASLQPQACAVCGRGTARLHAWIRRLHVMNLTCIQSPWFNCVSVSVRVCKRGNNSLTSASGLCAERSCQQNLIFLPPLPSLGRQIISFGSTGGLSALTALNNSEDLLP